jgi:hypothetical protein
MPAEVEARVAKGELNGVLQKPCLSEEFPTMIKRAIKSA